MMIFGASCVVCMLRHLQMSISQVAAALPVETFGWVAYLHPLEQLTWRHCSANMAR